MIFGDLPHLAVAQHVGARIPRPQTGEMIAARQQRDQRRGDHRIAAAPFGFLAQRLVRRGDPHPHLAEQFGGGKFRRHRIECLGDQAGRVFAGLMASRAVGDSPDAEVGPIHPGVFVMLPFGSGVGRMPGANPVRDHDALSVGARWPSMDAIACGIGQSKATTAATLQLAARHRSTTGCRFARDGRRQRGRRRHQSFRRSILVQRRGAPVSSAPSSHSGPIIRRPAFRLPAMPPTSAGNTVRPCPHWA